MLRLDKLEIRGFKSFCDYTEVLFHEGVTAIVGPNGCGKSNVMDAITWVLGEQSAKNLRGGKMEDVIFNGTRDRKPVGMAEVLLTLTAVVDIEPNKRDEEELSADELVVPEIDIEAIEDTLEASTTDLPVISDSFGESAAGETQSSVREYQSSKKKPPRRYRIPTLAAGEKITIGRRLYRSGESDYLINGRTCRLRDILDFFSGTGLSRAHYAIIEQGRIGQVLSSKPHDRRALIEEAAGISKFKAKRHTTELKLESTRQNLSRLNDLVSEIERQVGSLKRQAARSRRYVALRDEMRVVARVFFAKSADHVLETHAAIRAALTASAEQLGTLAEQLHGCQVESAQARTAAREAEALLAEERRKAAQIELEHDRALNLHVHLKEQIEQTSARRSELSAEAGRYEERRRLVEKEIERSRRENEALATELSGDEQRLSTVEARYRAEYQALQECEKAQEQTRSHLLAHVTRTERLRSLEQQHRDTEARLVRQTANLESESVRAAERQTHAEEELKASLSEQQQIQSQAQRLREQLSAAGAAVTQATENVKQAQGRLNELQRERSRTEDRLGNLRKLDDHHAYFSSTVQTFFNEANKIPGLHVVGTLADFLNVPSSHESLVENVLGERLQAIVVPTIDDAVTATTWLNQKKGGRATFLVTGMHGGQTEGSGFRVQGSGEGALGAGTQKSNIPLSSSRLLDFLGLPEHLAATFARALPQLAEAGLAPDLNQALERSLTEPKRLFLTAEGEQVFAGSLVVTRGGERPPTSVLALKREIKELTKQVATLGKQVETATEALETANAELAEFRSERQTLDNQLRETETKSAALGVEVQQRRREVDRAVQHLNVIASERNQLDQEKKQLAERMKQNSAELVRAEEHHSALEEQLAAAAQKLATLKPTVEKISHELSEMRSAVAARLERRRAASTELRRLEHERQEAERARSQSEFEQVETAGRLEQLKKQLAECEAQSSRLAKDRSQSSEIVTKAVTHLETTRTAADALETLLNELHSRESGLREARTAQEVEDARLTSEFEHLARTCRNELGEPLETVRAGVKSGTPETLEPSESPALKETAPTFKCEDFLEHSLDDLAERLEDLRGKIEALGPVNMLALEELEESEKRQEFLVRQRADLLAAIAATEEALKEIRRHTKQRFLDAFTQINTNFTKIFSELFGGGRGEMVLIDQEDVLESGLDIIAQPPGKRLQSVLLLSGGEKAMAALSLVLAIFRYRPSPFCILDEVDAPLDDANIGRFTHKITEMSMQTQFLVITHSKKTMEASQSIYGVTMQEPGVSKLLSVKFD
ncbi:MAG: chromosome segregation protein SMC [Blastocatellia bacterium]|nr:chromosome segregation protein SMC [Blastocatellia bacterium]